MRSSSISSMSQLLLAGWAMLADSCPECGVSRRLLLPPPAIELLLWLPPPSLSAC